MATFYDFENRTAFNPETGEGTPNAVGQVYAKTDTTFSTPLVVTLMGSGLSVTDLTTDQYCQLQGFQAADLVQVVFKSGDFTKVLNTTTPLVGPPGPAVADAVDNGDGTVTFTLPDGSPAATVALPPGPQGDPGPAGLPATGAADDDAAIKTFMTTPGTATNTALSATIASETEGLSPKVTVPDPIPMSDIAQLPAGRVTIYVNVTDNILLTLDSFGLKQTETPLLGDVRAMAVANKTLPTGVSAGTAAGAAKIVKFKGLYYLQALASGVPNIYNASPKANPDPLVWSPSLRSMGAGANIITTGLDADASYLYWVTYGDPTGAKELHRFDGTTWTTVDLSAHFARHVHGVFVDPYNPGHVYITGGDGGSATYIIRSTNYGATWASLGPEYTSQGWQAVQLSFDETHIWGAPDTPSNFTVFKIDRATLTPEWATYKSHRFLPVPFAMPPRRITDLSTTAASNTITSATAAFTSEDVGSFIRVTSQDVVPIDCYIRSVTNATTAVLSKPANETAAGRTAYLGGSAWGAMAYYGKVDPITGIYYFVTINGAVGGNTDGLFAFMPNGEITLLGLLPFSPDGEVMISGGYVWNRGYRRKMLSV